MNKKLMILVAGALTVLAFTALTGTAAAKETKLKCEVSVACTFNVDSVGVTNFSLHNGDTVRCSEVTGKGEMINLDANKESATSTVQLLFHDCTEQNTIFHFKCTNTATAGTVTTTVMTGHNIALPGTPTEAGVLLTNADVTFTCAGGFAATQVTGNIIGEYEKKCGTTSTGTSQSITFNKTADGTQTDRTYTGVSYDLEGKTSHTGGGAYETGAQDGVGILTFNQNVELTCG
jgi:hypothetical protein